MLKQSKKQSDRRAKFAKIGRAITALEMSWRDRKGDHVFEMKPTPCHLTAEDGPTLAGGPLTKTVQFERGVRRGTDN